MVTESENKNMKIIRLNTGTIFNDYNGNCYKVPSEIILSTELASVNDVMRLLEDHKLIELTPCEGPSKDEELLFRLAAILDDKDFLMNVGTFTWMDDIDNMVKLEVVFDNIREQAVFTTLGKLLYWLNDEDVIDARETIEPVDMFNTIVLDGAYELYKKLVERMITI